MTDYSVEITLFKDGVEVDRSDALGDTPGDALYFAVNDLERLYGGDEEEEENA